MAEPTKRNYAVTIQLRITTISEESAKRNALAIIREGASEFFDVECRELTHFETLTLREEPGR